MTCRPMPGARALWVSGFWWSQPPDAPAPGQRLRDLHRGPDCRREGAPRRHGRCGVGQSSPRRPAPGRCPMTDTTTNVATFTPTRALTATDRSRRHRQRKRRKDVAGTVASTTVAPVPPATEAVASASVASRNAPATGRQRAGIPGLSHATDATGVRCVHQPGLLRAPRTSWRPWRAIVAALQSG